MNVGSVCSGIAAPEVAWRGLPLVPRWFAEIDPFPSAVLAHHYPSVPNLGDFTRLVHEPPPAVDVLVGGTPCQAFSVAGLRGGLADPRGKLTEAFVELAAIMRPRFIVWENVPGVLSIDGGKVFSDILVHVEQLGYVIDVDILDAQFFGVAQRRRRVFLVCQDIADIRRKRTSSSGLVLAQCLTEILGFILAEARGPSPTAQASLGRELGEQGHLAQRRMRLFGLQDPDHRAMWQESLDALRSSSETERAESDSTSGTGRYQVSTHPRGAAILSGVSSPAPAGGSPSIEPSWPSLLADLWPTMSAFTISTSTSSITELAICTCARAVLLIAEHIGHSMASSPRFWSAASSASTVMKEYTSYARRAVSNLFTGERGVREWDHFLREAERVHRSLGGPGDWTNPPPLLSLRQGLSWDSPPRRRSGAGVAGSVGTGASDGGGWRIGAYEPAANQVVPVGPGVDIFTGDGEVADPLSCSETRTYSHEGTNFRMHNCVAHTLRACGFDASEDGTGRGPPLIPFDTTQITSKANRSNPRAGDPCHPLAARAHPPAVAGRRGVRRLTPREMERLQGFPDDFTLLREYGAKKEVEADYADYYRRTYPDATDEQIARFAADGPRAKALGNSMAVPMPRWIGKRILEIDAI